MVRPHRPTPAPLYTALPGDAKGGTTALHIWGSALTHHPHVYLIVPGGGPSPDGSRWTACKPDFFLPVRVLWRFCAACSSTTSQRCSDANQSP